MVFCDAAMMASTVASVMMNGVCCMWQMQEEDDRREAIRRDIRVEYERQRLLDLELWAKRSAVGQRAHRDASVREQQNQQQEEVERRKALLLRKMSVSTNMKREDVEQERESVSSHSETTSGAVYSFENINMVDAVERHKKREEAKRKSYGEQRRREQLETATRAGSEMSSLLDSDDDDDLEDEASSLVDVALQ